MARFVSNFAQRREATLHQMTLFFAPRDVAGMKSKEAALYHVTAHCTINYAPKTLGNAGDQTVQFSRQ